MMNSFSLTCSIKNDYDAEMYGILADHCIFRGIGFSAKQISVHGWSLHFSRSDEPLLAENFDELFFYVKSLVN
jgi:hypothetical protein